MLNNTLIDNQEITEEIKEEIKKYLETNGNENTKIQNLWDAAKAVLRGKFITIQSYLKKKETSQINHYPNTNAYPNPNTYPKQIGRASCRERV